MNVREMMSRYDAIGMEIDRLQIEQDNLLNLIATTCPHTKAAKHPFQCATAGSNVDCVICPTTIVENGVVIEGCGLHVHRDKK